MASVSKKKKIKAFRQKLELFRSNEPSISVLMWGIHYSSSTVCSPKPRITLLKDDYKARMKVKVNNIHFNKENMPSNYKFKEYCPMVFVNLRFRFGINSGDYAMAFNKHQPVWDSILGKSGSKFLVTHNRQFVAKTVSVEEVEQLNQILEEYYAYIVTSDGRTLLPQFLGLYRISVNDQETYILVMRNVFSPRLPVHKMCNFRPHQPRHMQSFATGCIAGDSGEEQRIKLLQRQRSTLRDPISSTSDIHRRQTASAHHGLNETSESSPKSDRLSHRCYLSLRTSFPKTLSPQKNSDLNDVCKIYLGESTKSQFLTVLESDIQFLQENNLMGYSLIIGLHEIGQAGNPLLPQASASAAGEPGGSGSPVEVVCVPPSAACCEEEQRGASAGDGLGSIASAPMLHRLSLHRVQSPVSEENSSGSEDDLGGGSGYDLDTLDTLIGSGFSLGVVAGSPSNESHARGNSSDGNEAFPLELYPYLEYYAIKSSPESPRRLIYFLAIEGILNRHGAWKRSHRAHSSGQDGGQMKPEVYGRRIMEFTSQCIF